MDIELICKTQVEVKTLSYNSFLTCRGFFIFFPMVIVNLKSGFISIELKKVVSVFIGVVKFHAITHLV